MYLLFFYIVSSWQNNTQTTLYTFLNNIAFKQLSQIISLSGLTRNEFYSF